MLKQRGVIFIVLGDEKQVPPIGDEREYGDHAFLHSITNGNKIVLTEVHRYDLQLKENLFPTHLNRTSLVTNISSFFNIL